MTVSTTSYLIQYSGDDSTTAFATGFEFINDTDLVVVLTSAAGVDTTQTITTDYTVTGAGVDAGGTVTMATAPAAGERLTIYRNTALTQATDYTAFDKFPAETHEQALDKLTLQVQEVSGRQDRTIKFRETEDRSGGTKNSYMPTPVAGAVLSYDSDGNLTTTTLGTVSFDLSISGGDAGKVVVVNGTEDGIEVGALPVSGAATANTIVSRGATGRIKSADPNADDDVATRGWVDAKTPTLLRSTSVTAVSSIDLADVFSSNSGYRFFMIELRDVTVATGAPALWMRVSIDGSSFLSTSAYSWAYSQMDSAAGTVAVSSGGSDTEINLSNFSTSGTPGRVIIKIENPHDSSNRVPFSWDRVNVNGVTSVEKYTGVGAYDSGTVAIHGIQFLWAGGQNFAAQGLVRVYGSNIPF